MRRRHGFTLIELLVVISLIGVLAALAVLFVPALGDKERAARGGQMLQQWLQQARQKAQRDQSPRGVRVLPPANGTFVTQCQFIEVPEDFTGGKIIRLSSTKVKNNSGINYRDFIAIGDYLEILGNGLMYRIVNIEESVTPGLGDTLVVQAPGFDQPPNFVLEFQETTHYRILRQPRVTNDELLQFPDGVAIDVNPTLYPGYSMPPQTPPVAIDLVFTPSGQLILPQATTDAVCLLVRDMEGLNAYGGDSTIIAVHVRSGLVAAHPPADGPDPFQFVKDGRSSK